MGKASRMKKERKPQDADNIDKGPMARSQFGRSQSAQTSAKVHADMQALFAGLGGGNLMPFARRIAKDYLEELAAAAERAELESVIGLEEPVAEAVGLRI